MFPPVSIVAAFDSKATDRFADRTAATAGLRKRLSTMPSDAAYFRERAAHCRKLAEATRDQPTLKMLLELAEDFDAEAANLDAEEGVGAKPTDA